MKQSKYEVCGKLPIRSVTLGPDGSGKTVLLQNMTLDIYKDCFSYMKKHTQVKNTAKEPIYFGHCDPEVLANMLETQHKITNFLKRRGDEKLFQVLIIIDDFEDNPSLTRQSKLLHTLYMWGRHNTISTIIATQIHSAIHHIIRVNATEF